MTLDGGPILAKVGCQHCHRFHNLDYAQNRMGLGRLAVMYAPG
jgi:hypothetical protein